jgi:uncharacterized protein YjiK
MICLSFFNSSLYYLLLFTIFSFIACVDKSSEQKNMIKASFQYSTSNSTVTLPKKLNELSGLAMKSDGRLFGHNDEKADILQIDPHSGSIIKSFSVGEKTLKDDFEGIAIVDDLFYLVTSGGEIYEFREGSDDAKVSYKKYKTKLNSRNDVEGLCYDPNTESLLIACKGDPGKNYNGKRAVYSFSLKKKELMNKPRFLISINEISDLEDSGFAQKLGDFFLLTDSKFAPSGIEKHPQSDSFYILSSQGPAIIEISAEGKLLSRMTLNRKHHNQPEGITFSSDMSLLIGDEAGNDKAKITTYPFNANK